MLLWKSLVSMSIELGALVCYGLCGWVWLLKLLLGHLSQPKALVSCFKAMMCF